jgi:hypothetical protein
MKSFTIRYYDVEYSRLFADGIRRELKVTMDEDQLKHCFMDTDSPYKYIVKSAVLQREALVELEN